MNWISKAAGALKGDDSPGQAFNLFCECGQQHQGIRRQKWQRIVCRACGGSLFVLQKDPYPPPKEHPAVKVAVPAEMGADEENADDEIRLEQSAVIEKRGVREAVSRPRLKSKGAANASNSAKPHPEVVAAPTLSVPNKRLLKPFHIVILLIVAIAGLTIYGTIRSSQKRRATTDLKDSVDGIQNSMNTGAWVDARNQLEVAVRAMETLDRSETDIAPFRQQLRETTAMTSLASQPVSELLDEAEKADSAGEEAFQQYQFKVRGQYLFIEGAAQRQITDTVARVQHRIELPMAVGNQSQHAFVVLQSTELARLLEKQDTGNVILAAKISSVEHTPVAWEIRTEPDSVVLWTSSQTFEGLGFSKDETQAVQETLDRQAASLGVKHDAQKK
jgi:hypothetical protein